MKIKIINILNLVIFFFCLLPIGTWAASYEVSTSTLTVDGDTFCGGSACTSSDTITIEGGARGTLRFRDFNGNGSYITIKNEDTNRVVITHDTVVGQGVLSFDNCKYIDFRGNNNISFTYGIKVINDGSPSTPSHTVWVYGESDHIKISYVEVDFIGVSGRSGTGLSVHDKSLTSAHTFETFEIHHNYIHDTRYAGMYLGHNQPDPGQDDRPYTANFSIHDNILEDIGSYGMNLKGIIGGNNYIFKNTIKRTGQNCDAGSGAACSAEKMGDGYAVGMKILWTYGEAFVKIYDNWIEKTPGQGIRLGEANHLVHDNTIVGCGFGVDDPTTRGHGITIDEYDWMRNRPDRTVKIYDNTIVEANRYGIYASNSSYKGSHYSNIIAESGIGETSGSGLTEGTGEKANLYEADADDVGFNVWIDDGDYSNDDFTLVWKKTQVGIQAVKGFCIK